MADKKNYQIRRMSLSGLKIAVDWAVKEGWNLGVNDADCYIKVDPKGFFMGFLDNEPISCISAISYNHVFGFIGFYIVKPEFRDKGYGLQIGSVAMDYLKDHNIGLDGVVEQQENYKKSGFNLAYRNIRYQGRVEHTQKDDRHIVDLTQIPFTDLASYDAAFFPQPRHDFLKSWIRQPQSVALGILSDGKLAGYCVLRKGLTTGYKFGPLYADNAELAETLFQSACSRIPQNEAIFVDTPEPNTAAKDFVKRHNMKPVFETARMYSGEIPDLSIDRTYGITSFEIG